MDENENVLTEEHPFGIEPETYSELEENHPKLFKNTESGTSPVKNPFDDKGSAEIKSFKINISANKRTIAVQGGITKLKKKPRIVKAYLHYVDEEVEAVHFNSNGFIGKVYYIFDNLGYYYKYYSGSTTLLSVYNSDISFTKDENTVWINLIKSSVYFNSGEWTFYYVEGEEDW